MLFTFVDIILPDRHELEFQSSQETPQRNQASLLGDVGTLHEGATVASTALRHDSTVCEWWFSVLCTLLNQLLEFAQFHVFMQEPSPLTYRRDQVITLPVKREFDEASLHPSVCAFANFNQEGICRQICNETVVIVSWIIATERGATWSGGRSRERRSWERQQPTHTSSKFKHFTKVTFPHHRKVND